MIRLYSSKSSNLIISSDQNMSLGGHRMQNRTGLLIIRTLMMVMVMMVMVVKIPSSSLSFTNHTITIIILAIAMYLSHHQRPGRYRRCYTLVADSCLGFPVMIMMVMMVMMMMILVNDSNLRSSKLQPCSNPPCCASFVILC